MPFIDVRTLFVNYVLAAALSLVVMGLLWVQNRRRFAGIGFWLLDYTLHLIALALLVLRGVVPDLVSIVVANVLIIGGAMLLLNGLQRFVGRVESHRHNLVMLAVFTVVHAYFAFVHPILAVRNINFSVALIFVCVQGAWLMCFRVGPRLRAAGRVTGYVLAAISALSIVQIANNVVEPQGSDLMRSNLLGALSLAIHEVLFLSLTFALTLLVNYRLRAELETELHERELTERKLRESEERLSKSFQSSPNAIAITGLKDGRFIEVNDAFVTLSGYSHAELVNKSSLELGLWVDEGDRSSVTSTLAQGRPVGGREYRFRRRNGEHFIGLYFAQVVKLDQGDCLFSMIQDVTVRKQEELELRQNRHFLAELIEHSRALICTKDADGRYELVNRQWEQLSGYSREHAIGKTDEELFPGDIGRRFRADDLTVLETGRALETEVQLDTPLGKRCLLSLKFPLRADNGEFARTCAIVTDITDRKKAEEHIRHLATHDPLTDLPSRRLALDRLMMAIRSARREQQLAGVLFIDLDGFKAINDTRGHAIGDYLLKELAQRMVARLRETDTVARIGGDEFLVIIGALNSANDALHVARKLLAELTRPVECDGFTVTSGASIGIALYPTHSEDLDGLVRLADVAMYRVKKAQKNGILMTEPESMTMLVSESASKPRRRAV